MEEITTKRAILQVLEKHPGDPINARVIREEMAAIGKCVTDGAVHKALSDLHCTGWIRRYRTKSGRLVYRSLEDDERLSDAVRANLITDEDEKKKEKEKQLTIFQLRIIKDRTKIGEEFRVRIPNGNEEKETKRLKVIRKTKHLCIFEGNRSCQWWDVYMYLNGAFDHVG
ncbi:MAG: hypothetical protein PUB12_06775 [[Clostridium] aminophilum]|uniref:hypothetical protein n=1 Tax=[Clostridium] aminophilum TaxID=1526 RepID=UPI0026EB907F|nr:hypothetical protein [[Clostridium] aminophilum]MDD6196574.1 hypothetical protein [[Clostridium] aminophilum]